MKWLILQYLKKPQGSHGEGNGYTEQEKFIFEKLYDQCKLLNRKGKVI